MGKGSSPRNCFSRGFRENYDAIDWSITKQESEDTTDATIEDQHDPVKHTCDCDCEDQSCANE